MNHHDHPTPQTEQAVLQSADLAGDAAPPQVLLAPWGTVQTAHGAFVVDEESLRLAIDAFEGHGTDLPIDFEHQTLGGAFASPDGTAPAAGWIKRLVGRPDVGLFAEIEWTAPGREFVSAKQYRYLSPVAIIRKADQKLVAIHSAALTNKPAIVGMEPLVNATARHSTAPSAAGGVRCIPVASSNEGSSEDRCFSAWNRLRAELQLPGELDAEAVLIAAGQRLFELREAGRRQRVEGRIHEALRTGKLVEAQRAWAEELIVRDEALFEEWFRTAPVVIQPGICSAPATRSSDLGCHTKASRARAEYRTSPLLQRLTSEDAFIADAVRTPA